MIVWNQIKETGFIDRFLFGALSWCFHILSWWSQALVPYLFNFFIVANKIVSNLENERGETY